LVALELERDGEISVLGSGAAMAVLLFELHIGRVNNNIPTSILCMNFINTVKYSFFVSNIGIFDNEVIML
jgi:hypothetical protein